MAFHWRLSRPLGFVGSDGGEGLLCAADIIPPPLVLLPWALALFAAPASWRRRRPSSFSLRELAAISQALKAG